MGLLVRVGDWYRLTDKMVVTGCLGAVVVLPLPAGTAQRPSFIEYEKVGYVARGEVALFIVDQINRVFGQRLPEGSFYRIPPTLVHWFDNAGPSDATLMEGLVIGPDWRSWDDFVPSVPLAADWENMSDFKRVHWEWFVDLGQLGLSVSDAPRWLERPPVGLVKTPREVNPVDVPTNQKVPLKTRVACGDGATVMVAERVGTYHSAPHVHSAEQFNLVVGGSNWAYAMGPQGRYFADEAKVGDVFRFPPYSVHWAWCRDGGGSHMVEFHFPGLHGDPDVAKGVVPLRAEDPALEPRTDRSRNLLVDRASVPVAAVEAGTL
ncbi:MAG: hypothetical protein IRZ33_05700 [Alicyclobacillaceae bacterium]|nr:hypothetical protein [Alicyclobacillaceae bacterium]